MSSTEKSIGSRIATACTAGLVALAVGGVAWGLSSPAVAEDAASAGQAAIAGTTAAAVAGGAGGGVQTPAAARNIVDVHAQKGIALDAERLDGWVATYCVTCHDRASVAQATEDLWGETVNPHLNHASQFDCVTCHRVDEAQTQVCNGCHDFDVPQGWAAPTYKARHVRD